MYQLDLGFTCTWRVIRCVVFVVFVFCFFFFFFSSRRRHTRSLRDWSSDVCSSDLLVYRDFARQGADRRYHAGPVISLEADSRSHTALLRAVALPHLQVLVGRVEESANLMVLAGDHARFVASVECDQSLRVGNREGMVFPAHLASGGKVMLADLPTEELSALFTEERWEGREGQRPDVTAVQKDLASVRRRGFAINKDRTETGVTAIGRG